MPAGVGAQPTADEDDWDRLARQNTDSERVDRDARFLPIEVALLHCEQQLGAAWVYAPGRWGTSDGCVPFRVVWCYFHALDMRRAVTALDTAHGIGLALGGENAQRSFDAASDQAFPTLPPAPKGGV